MSGHLARSFAGVVMFSQLLLVSSLMLGQQPDSLELRPADLVSGYRLNLGKFKSFRVTVRYSKQNREQWFREQEARILSYEKGVNESTNEDEKVEYLSALQRIQDSVKNPKAGEPVFSHFDFWTDRKGFQTRRFTEGDLIGAKGAKSIPAEFRFPDEPLADQGSLATTFKHIPIVSFDGDLKAGFRAWNGYLGSSYNASVWPKAPEYGEGWPLFPPLGVESEAWGKTLTWHEIDQFFALPVEQLSVEGTELVGGTKTYRLAHIKERPIASSLSQQLIKKYPKARSFNKTVAYVDPSRGFLPRKIAYYTDVMLEESAKPFAGRNDPWGILEVKRIELIPRGGFYPMEGIAQSFDYELPAVRRVERLRDLEGSIKGKYRTDKRGISDETAWLVTRVDAGWEPSPGMFDLPFPDNTLYFDQIKQKGMLTGDPAKKIDENVQPLPPPVLPAPNPTRRYILVGTNVALIIFVVVLFVVVKRRKKASR
jgi:hypothetical protein